MTVPGKDSARGNGTARDDTVPDRASSYFRALHELLGRAAATDGDGAPIDFDEGARSAVRRLLAARDAGHKAMVIGNGGSAAIASHLQNDLGKTVELRALVFNEPATLTARSNDDGYERAFEAQLCQWADPGDVLIAISSSGASENILRAVRAARARSLSIITMSGFAADNPLRQLGNVNFYVPIDHYGHVELAHQILAHYLTDTAETQLKRQEARSDELAAHLGDGGSWVCGRRSRIETPRSRT
ncbi:MAG: SIS domain-containing protein [Planctomycetota bacterium]